MSAALTYVYCLVRSPRRPPVRVPPDGLPGAHAVRVLDAGSGLWAVVADVPAAEYDEAALARGLQDLEWVAPKAMAHEAVVERYLGAAALLPMQLFTLFTSDARALEHVARDRPRIDRILARIERRLEWGLRLTFDEQAARADVERQHAPRAGASRGRVDGGTAGAAYLARKRDLFNVRRARLGEAKAAADRLYRAVAAEADEARRRTEMEQTSDAGARARSRLLLDAAFLVPARRSAAFRSAVRTHARALGASGVVVSLTGPWPAYNFIEARAATRRRDGSRQVSRRRRTR